MTGSLNRVNVAMMPKAIKIPTSVYLRYVLLNLPGLAGFTLVLILVRQWLGFPGWLFWVLIAGWILKEAVLFPAVWRAYDHRRPDGIGSLVGLCGITKKRLDPSGYIQVRGELWKAERAGGGPPIEAGRQVRIHGRDGLTLHVVPEDAQDT
jgi:membrane protein implicated in regulation of membrane protease activity